MREIIVSGRTVDEAVREGLETLGVDRDDVNVEVLDPGGKGLLGLLAGRSARVRLVVRQLVPADGQRGPSPGPGSQTPAAQAPVDRTVVPAPAPVRPPVAEPSEKDALEGGAGAEAPGPEREETPCAAEGPAVAGAERAAKVERAREFLAGLAQRMGVEAQIDTRDDGEYVFMNLEGPRLGLMIGRRGQTLDAVQYLVNVAANLPGGQWVRLVVDAEGYRQRREETLRHLAFRLAARVKSYGRRQVLEPMTPQERRIIHTTLQDDPEVTTYSEGDEPARHVVIALKDGVNSSRKPGGQPGGRVPVRGYRRVPHGGRDGGGRRQP
ncbi:MAG: protein jag [Firmicutes bacterium]|nr:protein jag [Bacillota bacterium]